MWSVTKTLPRQKITRVIRTTTRAAPSAGDPALPFRLGGHVFLSCGQDVAGRLLTPETATCCFGESWQQTVQRGRKETSSSRPTPCHWTAAPVYHGPGLEDVVARAALLLEDSFDGPWTKSMVKVDKVDCAAGPSFVAMWQPFLPRRWGKRTGAAIKGTPAPP